MTARWIYPLLLVGGVASADPAPAVDVRDLPPLPEIGGEENVAAIAVVAAQHAEEDLVVGAAKREQSLGNVASAVTVIPGDRLRRFGYRTVAEALAGVAGLYVVNDRMVDRLGIRGLQLLGDFNTRILVLVDGATVNEPWNQYTGIGFDLPVSIDDVARIEVVRGPVSSVYGTNAFFGIVNIVTRAADQSPRVYARAGGGAFGNLSTTVGGAYGSVNRSARASFGWGMRGGEDVSLPEFGGSKGADGMDFYNLAAAGQFDGGFAQVRKFRRSKELTWAPYDTVIGDDDNVEIDDLLLIEAGYTREWRKRVTVTVRGYYNRYRYEDFLVYTPDPAFRDIGTSEWMGVEVRGYARLLDRNRLGLTAGFEVTDVKTRSRSFEIGDEAGGADVPADFGVQGVYGELESSPLPWLSASGGVRFDRNTTFSNRLSPRAALFLHQGEDYGLKLLYAEGFRNPSAYEAFFFDNIDYVANPALAPETIRSYEAVVWGRPIPGLNLRLSAFRWEMDSLIEQEEVDIGGGELRLQYLNIAEMTSTGAEAEAHFRTTTGWLAFGSLTFALVERDGSADNAANAPQVVAAGGASTPKLAGLFHLSTEVKLIGSRRTRDAMIEADPFLGWNAALYLPDFHGVDVTVGARNLIGRSEQVPAQEDFDRTNDGVPIYLIPGEGREIYARVGGRY